MGEMTKREDANSESLNKNKKKRKKSQVTLNNQIAAKKSVVAPYPFPQSNHAVSVAAMILPSSSTN